jgi:hypothetical protein
LYKESSVGYVFAIAIAFVSEIEGIHMSQEM